MTNVRRGCTAVFNIDTTEERLQALAERLGCTASDNDLLIGA